MEICSFPTPHPLMPAKIATAIKLAKTNHAYVVCCPNQRAGIAATGGKVVVVAPARVAVTWGRTGLLGSLVGRPKSTFGASGTKADGGAGYAAKERLRGGSDIDNFSGAHLLRHSLVTDLSSSSLAV